MTDLSTQQIEDLKTKVRDGWDPTTNEELLLLARAIRQIHLKNRTAIKSAKSAGKKTKGTNVGRAESDPKLLEQLTLSIQQAEDKPKLQPSPQKKPNQTKGLFDLGGHNQSTPEKRNEY